MPRPFPLPLNIGTDICSIPRILTILKGRNGIRFVRRVLSEREREEGLERLDAPVDRWRRAVRAGIVLDWKRRELGLGLKELTRRRHKALGLGLELVKMGKKSTLNETEELRRELEREVRAEEMSARKKEELEACERECVADEDSTVTLGEVYPDMARDEESEETEDLKKVEVIGDVSPAYLKQKRLEDADIMIRLMDDNEKELAVAEEGLKKAAEFMAGRFAAKEAAIKAHHYRKLTYHSIAIHRPPHTDPKEGSQPPIAVILPETGEWDEGEEVKISISHDTDYATAVCLAHERRPKFHQRQPRKRRAAIPRHLRSANSGGISETNRDIFAQLEMDDMDPEEQKDDYRWKETIIALDEKEKSQAAIGDPKKLVKIENLAEDVTEEDLLEFFKGSSEKLKAHVAMSSDGKRHGYGLVSFGSSREAVLARRKVDTAILKGKKITCRWMGNKQARTRGLGMDGKWLFKGEDTGR